MLRGEVGVVTGLAARCVVPQWPRPLVGRLALAEQPVKSVVVPLCPQAGVVGLKSAIKNLNKYKRS